MAEQPPGSERGDRLHFKACRKSHARASIRNSPIRDIMMRLHTYDRTAFVWLLFDRRDRASSVVHSETGSQSCCLANRAPHHTCMCAPRWQCLSAVHAFVSSATDPRARCLAAVQPLLDTAQAYPSSPSSSSFPSFVPGPFSNITLSDRPDSASMVQHCTAFMACHI